MTCQCVAHIVIAHSHALHACDTIYACAFMVHVFGYKSYSNLGMHYVIDNTP